MKKRVFALALVLIVSIACVIGLSACDDDKDQPDHVCVGDWVTVTAATCTNAGVKESVCKTCKKVLATGEIPAIGHHYDEVKWVWEDVNAVAQFACASDCGHIEEVVATVTSSTIVAPSCEKAGTQELKATVDFAGKTYTDIINVPIAATGHKAGDWEVAKAATCTAEGLKVQKCACGKIMDQEVIPMADHKESGWITDEPATCTKEGTQHTECTECEKVLNTGKIDKIPHTEGEWHTTIEESCLTDGEEKTNCTECGAEMTRVRAAKGHTAGDKKTVAATCETDGYTCDICTDCGEEINKEVIKATGHDWTGWEIEVAATCTTEGSRVRSCKNDPNHIDRETLAIVPHTPVVNPETGEWIEDLAPTCTTNGSHHKECEVCGNIIETEIIDMLGHTYGDPVFTWDEIKSAKATFTCTREGCNHTETVDAVITSETEEPKCEVAGKTIYTATVLFNEKEYTNDVEKSIDALKHQTPDEFTVVEAATCEKDGYAVKNCTVCGKELERKTLTKLGHDYTDWDTVKEATCIEDGLKVKVCKNDPSHMDYEVIPATGIHKPGDLVTDVPATCTTPGVGHYECADCGYIIEIVPIEATGHKNETKFDETNHWTVCTVCGAEGEKVAHTLVPGKDEINHWTGCECGYKKDVAAHKFEQKSNDTHHWTECECGAKTEEVEHKAGTEFKSDDTKHWNECECGHKMNEAEHKYTDGKCECGKTEPVVEPEQPEGGETEGTDPEEKPEA